jgi:hypothetical protein
MPTNEPLITPHLSPRLRYLPAPTRPVFALDIPMSDIQVDAEVQWVTRPHEESLRNQVDELLVQQIQPAFARMRAMEGQEDRGPFLVAQDVSSQLYEASVIQSGILSWLM